MIIDNFIISIIFILLKSYLAFYIKKIIEYCFNLDKNITSETSFKCS